MKNFKLAVIAASVVTACLIIAGSAFYVVSNHVIKDEIVTNKLVVTNATKDEATAIGVYDESYNGNTAAELLNFGLVRNSDNSLSDAPGWIGFGSAKGSRLLSEESADAKKHQQQRDNEARLAPTKVQRANMFYIQDTVSALTDKDSIQTTSEALISMNLDGVTNVSEFINNVNSNKIKASMAYDKKLFVIMNASVLDIMVASDGSPQLLIDSDDNSNLKATATFDISYKASIANLNKGDNVELVCKIEGSHLYDCNGLQNYVTNNLENSAAVVNVLAGGYWESTIPKNMQTAIINSYKVN